MKKVENHWGSCLHGWVFLFMYFCQSCLELISEILSQVGLLPVDSLSGAPGSLCPFSEMVARGAQFYTESAKA